jgi:hypothetical protein
MFLLHSKSQGCLHRRNRMPTLSYLLPRLGFRGVQPMEVGVPFFHLASHYGRRLYFGHGTTKNRRALVDLSLAKLWG